MYIYRYIHTFTSFFLGGGRGRKWGYLGSWDIGRMVSAWKYVYVYITHTSIMYLLHIVQICINRGIRILIPCNTDIPSS